jgi:uncharacterized repeat protein (TIGR03803 family)
MLCKTFAMERSAMLVLLVFGVLRVAAWAQTETVLYTFCAQTKCTDGGGPSGLVFGPKGDLYGTTQYGGANDSCNDSSCGAVFKLSPEGKETVLYSFCGEANCIDGYYPEAGVVFDQKGNLYGTTAYGGAHGNGVAFKLAPDGQLTILHHFCAWNGCTDGGVPYAGLVLDDQGNVYGTTTKGGAYNNNLCYGYGCGVVFRITPEGKYVVLYSFCAQNNCVDGANPFAGLVFDPKGNLYGTTARGGAYNSSGVVFKITPQGKETVLYSFCAQTNCVDGFTPVAGLIFDSNGNLYGTTEGGGTASGYGTVFKLTPKGRESVLYSFCIQSYCPDGAFPMAGVVRDQKGNLYGTTPQGGGYNFYCFDECGLVFKVSPKGKETVLHIFCTEGGSNCTDGEDPEAGLVFDGKGNLYGTTYNGGAHGGGVVFKLTP